MPILPWLWAASRATSRLPFSYCPLMSSFERASTAVDHVLGTAPEIGHLHPVEEFAEDVELGKPPAHLFDSVLAAGTIVAEL